MKTSKLFFIITAALLLGFTSYGQVEETHTLTLAAAKKIMKAATDYAKANNAPGAAIAIVDAGGHLDSFGKIRWDFSHQLQKFLPARQIPQQVFKFESKKLEDGILGGRNSLITVGHNMLRGGIPIMYEGQVIGAIGVSGSASADQDVDMAKAGAAIKFD